MLNIRKSISYNRHNATGIEKANLYMPDRRKRLKKCTKRYYKIKKTY